MKPKNKRFNMLKRIAFYGSFLAFLNYYALPIAGCVGTKQVIKEAYSKKIPQVCKTDEHLEDIMASIDKYTCKPIELLKAAHAITSKKLDYEKTFWSGKAFKGKADCKYFSLFTYTNFLYLADQIGIPSIKDQVRLMIGFEHSEGKTGYGHAWLQVKIDDKWHDYETTEDPIKRDEKIDFKNLDEKIPDEHVLDRNECTPCSQVQYEDGLLKARTNFTFSFETGADFKSYWH